MPATHYGPISDPVGPERRYIPQSFLSRLTRRCVIIRMVRRNS